MPDGTEQYVRPENDLRISAGSKGVKGRMIKGRREARRNYFRPDFMLSTT